MSLVRANQRRLPRPRGAGRGLRRSMIRFSAIEYHIENRAHTRLCDGSPASDADISSSDWSALRDARRDAMLCPDCQDRVNPRDVRPKLYGYSRMSTVHLHTVPVLVGFDVVRNCSQCRRNTDDDCKAWRKLRKDSGRSQAGGQAVCEDAPWLPALRRHSHMAKLTLLFWR